MRRAFLFVMDSVGIGGAPDAASFGDEGANTVGHISDRMKLHIPNLTALGLAHAVQAASGSAHGLNINAATHGSWGYATEVSQGKDTITGHWELMASVCVIYTDRQVLTVFLLSMNVASVGN